MDNTQMIRDFGVYARLGCRLVLQTQNETLRATVEFAEGGSRKFVFVCKDEASVGSLRFGLISIWENYHQEMDSESVESAEEEEDEDPT